MPTGAVGWCPPMVALLRRCLVLRLVVVTALLKVLMDAGGGSAFLQDTSLQSRHPLTLGYTTNTSTHNHNLSADPHAAWRLQRIRQFCTAHPEPPPQGVRRLLYVDEGHRLLMCLPLKAGCTTWKTILVNNSVTREKPLKHPPSREHLSQSKHLETLGIRRLRWYSADEQRHIIDNYFKVIVVRHPLDRLVSAYNDKFVVEPDNHYSRDLIRVADPQRVPTVTNRTRLTFPQFLEYILKARDLNEHWEPVSSECQPCFIRYDYVVKLETQSADADRVIRGLLGPHHRGARTVSNRKGHGAARMDGGHQTRVLHEYRSVPGSVLSGVIGRLGYWRDLAMFGYGWRRLDNGSVEVKVDSETRKY